MAFIYALFAALCIAQGFAFTRVARSDEDNNDPAEELSFEFAGMVDEFGKLTSTATADTSETGANLDVILLCLGEQRDDYVQLGRNVSDKVRAASKEITEILGNTAEKYAQMLRPSLTNITNTLKKLPEDVSNSMKNGDLVSAMKIILEARESVRANARFVGEKMRDMVAEVPQVAGLAEKRAREIRQQAKEGMEKIKKAFKECVERGGPSKITGDEA